MSYPPWTSVSEAAALLASGHIVAIPTETVYGLAGNALDPLALAKIFAAKGRPVFDPLIVHIADINSLDNVAQDIPEAAYTLARTFWPGPLTMVLPKKPCIPDLATSGLSTVAVRLPQHPIAQDYSPSRSASCGSECKFIQARKPYHSRTRRRPIRF